MAKNYTYVRGAAFPYQYRYEHPAVTTDCVIFTYEDRTLKVLLVRRGGEPYKGEWALPGGFIRSDETAYEGARRELFEETGLTASAIGELGTFSKPDRDPRERVITIAFYALVKPSEVKGGDDAVEAAWFPIDDLPVLAFDHEEILQSALERLKKDIHFEPIGFELLNDKFTIPDLQRLYEIILGVKFDRRNFQRKIMASGILEEADDLADDGDAKMSVLADEPGEAYLDDNSFIDDAVSYCCAPEASLPPSKPKRRPGRIASLFKLNKAKYDQMKEEGGKFEF